MFTGIIQHLGTIEAIETDKKNKTFTIKSPLAPALKIDQSVAHNGVCLTVISCDSERYKVTAIHETIQLTTVKNWQVGDLVNLETAARLNAQLDGHIVQGHVDSTGQIINIQEESGSTRYTIEFDSEFATSIISKGSICVDGVSLTAISPTMNTFEVAIIPFTNTHTIFHTYKIGTAVNLEFDILGKYFLRYQEVHKIK